MFRFQSGRLTGFAFRYALALGAAAASALLRHGLTVLVGEGLPTYITFYPAVMIAALVGGFGPGLLTTGLVAAWTAYWILPPPGFLVESLRDTVGLALFSGMGMFMSTVAELYRRARVKAAEFDKEAALRHVNAQLQAANEELHLANETLERRVAERTGELEHRMAQLQALAAQLTRAEEQERRRLARILHDGLQQLLVGARMRLETARGSEGVAQAKDLQAVLDLLTESLTISRSLTAELYPQVLSQEHLAGSLQWLGRWFTEKQGLAVRVQADPAVRVATEEVRIALFQAVRELLLNVVKHAGVKEASVSLDWDHVGAARIVVSDAGVGFNPSEVRAREGTTGGFGLFSLRERLELLGASLTAESAPGRGSRFTILTQPEPRD